MTLWCFLLLIDLKFEIVAGSARKLSSCFVKERGFVGAIIGISWSEIAAHTSSAVCLFLVI